MGEVEIAAVSLETPVARLIKLARSLRPSEYLGTNDLGSIVGRIRGNLALLFTAVCEAQKDEEASATLTNVDLSPLVEVFVDSLRKERGTVQYNAGVLVTRLAQNKRYLQLVRDLNGIESLHQIQKPRVEAKHERDMKIHRIRGPQRDGE